MSINTITATIAGNTIPILDGSFGFDSKVDERDSCSFQFDDPTATLHFRKGARVTVTDSIQGNFFTGVVDTDSEEVLTPNSRIRHTIKCVDRQYDADRRVSRVGYDTPQYAGIIAVDQAKRYLESEGITPNYALDIDSTQSDFATGTLTNTLATNNVDDGDLELALAGAKTTLTVQSLADFNAGSYFGCGYANGALTPTATPAIKMVANCTLNNAGNLYTYIKIWGGSQLLGTGYYLIYDEWIDPASPEAKMSVDIMFTDGTTLRDSFVYADSQALSPHPLTDLAGLANGQWYHREFWLNNFNGKTIQYITLGCEGDKVGVYTGWFKNVKITDQNKTTVLNVFNGTINTSQQLQNVGYSSTTLSVVQTYALGFYLPLGDGSLPWTQNITAWNGPSQSIDAVKILRTSFLSYKATTPPGTICYVKYSLDYPGGATVAVLCPNNAPLPQLPAGMSVAGRTLNLNVYFARDPNANPLSSPEVTPSLQSITLLLYPSYAMPSKTDVRFACAQQSDWTQAGAVLTNTTTYAAFTKLLALSGYVNNFDSSYGSTNLYCSGTVGVYGVTINNRTLAITTTASTDCRLRLNDAPQLTNFTAEVDVLVDANYSVGLVYRTTNWGNANDSYGYCASITPTQLLLAHGNNSTGTGVFTTVASATISLTSGKWHRLKVIANGTNHQVFLDDIRLINATDSTYTAAGYVGLRTYASVASTQTGYFDNFGIMNALTGTWVSPSISLAPATTYGASQVTWRDQREDSTNGSILVESSINGGSTWQALTNGGSIPGLTASQSLAGVNVLIRITLTTTTASSLPAIDNLVVRVLQAFSASGTRVSPALALAPAGRAGATLTAWNANAPAGTSVAVATSLDSGATYQAATSGGAISGITGQSQIIDTFNTNTSSSYLSFTYGGGTVATWTYDTANSRLVATGGVSGAYQRNDMTAANDTACYVDMDYSDGAGPLINAHVGTGGSTDLYYLVIADNSASSAPGTMKLFKRLGGVLTQVGSASINFPRNTPHRFLLQETGGVVTASMDGVLLITYNDPSPVAAGKAGVIMANGGRAQFYNLRIQALGDNLTGKSVQTRVTLTSTDPTATPQLLDLTVAALSPDIGLGTLIPSADYANKYVSANIADAASQSDYQQRFTPDGRLIMQARQAAPAPFVLTSDDVLIDGISVENGGDLYRNRMILYNVVDSASFSEQRTGDGKTRSWSLSYTLSQAPTITLNGQVQSVGQKGIDTGKQFYWESGTSTISQDDTGTLLQQDVDVLIVSGVGDFTTSVQRDNTGQFSGTVSQAQFQAITGGTGLVEIVEDGKGMRKDAAIAYGDSQLQRYGRIGRTVHFKTLRDGLVPGQDIPVFLAQHGIVDADMLVASVGIEVYITSSGNQKYWYTSEATEEAASGSWAKLMSNAFSSSNSNS